MEGTMTMPNSQPTNLATSLLEWKEEGRDVRWLGRRFVFRRFCPSLPSPLRPTNGFETSQPNHPCRLGGGVAAAVGERDSHGRRRHYSWSASLPWEREKNWSVLSACLLSGGEDRPPMT